MMSWVRLLFKDSLCTSWFRGSTTSGMTLIKMLPRTQQLPLLPLISAGYHRGAAAVSHFAARS